MSGRTSGSAITSLVVGIISLPFFCLGIWNLLTVISALTLGITALIKINRGEAGGKGIAIAGICVCSVSLLLTSAILILGLIGQHFAQNFLDKIKKQQGMNQGVEMTTQDNDEFEEEGFEEDEEDGFEEEEGDDDEFEEEEEPLPQKRSKKSKSSRKKSRSKHKKRQLASRDVDEEEEINEEDEEEEEDKPRPLDYSRSRGIVRSEYKDPSSLGSKKRKLKTKDGKTYKGRFIYVGSKGIDISIASGIKLIKFKDLSEKTKKKYYSGSR